MASVILSSGVVVGNQSLVTNGAYTSYDLTKSGSFPAAGYRVASATLTCTLRNAVWDTITVKAADGTTLGSFGAVGTNGERTCALITGYDYASLTHVTLLGGGVGTQIAGGSYVTITVEWAYTTSALTLSAASVDAGGTVTASIGAYDPAFSHQVRLEFGTKTQTWDVAAGVTVQAVTVPVAWLDQIPTAQSGPARVTLITYSAGVYVGAVAASLTVTVPASAAPTFSASCAPLLTVGGTTYPSMGSGVYVQGKSGCTAKITGAAAQYGAAVTGYSIRGGGYSGTSATLQTGLLGGSGTVPFVFRVTDSRGLYTEKTVNIAVLAYTPPQVSSLTGWRVDSAGAAAPAGTLGKCRAVWSYTSLGGANTCAVKAFIKPAGGSETALNAAMASGVDYWVATAAGNSIAFGKACERSNAVEIAAGRTLYLGDSTLRDWIRNTFFPVGAIYQSYAATSPASLFGGTWTQIQNRFLVGVGSSYAAGATGGEATHKLTVDELPSHSHNYSYPGYEAGGEWYGASGTAKGNTVATTAVGGGAAHENRPPYYAVYIWRRTA